MQVLAARSWLRAASTASPMPSSKGGSALADFARTIKRWFGRQERRAVRAEEYEREFDAMIDRLAARKDHVIDRIKDAGETGR